MGGGDFLDANDGKISDQRLDDRAVEVPMETIEVERMLESEVERMLERDAGSQNYFLLVYVPNVEHRTHSVIDVIKGYYEGIIMPNEILLVLPRHLLITDVDAILDGFVFTKWLVAQHQHDMITSTNENVQKL